MRKLFNHFLLIPLILAGVGFFVMPNAAHAADWLDVLTGGTDIFYGIIGKIFWIALIPLAGQVLTIIGGVMDYAINIATNPSVYNNDAINATWTIIRDLANMVFIFVLVYEGIRTILGIGNASKIKKTVTSVVIAALLLNFSLFFTKVFIDASNVGASWFIQGVRSLGGQESISSSVRASLQMERMTGTYKNFNPKSFTLTSFMQGILLFSLILVATYVLFRVTLLIIGRIVAFILLLITSPIGFTGALLDLGEISSYAKQWWDEMLKQMMMLPMFFLMLYITLYLVDRFDTVFSTATAQQGGFEPINYFIFVIIIAFLLKSLEVANEHSGKIGSMAAKFTQQAVSIGLGGVAMGTIGKAATAVQSNKAFQAWSARSGIIGEAAMRATRSTASADFGVKSSFGSMTKGTAFADSKLTKDAFKGADKGYSGKVAQEVKDTKEYVKVFGKGLPGAINRKAYIDNLESGIYGRVVPKPIRSTINTVKENIATEYDINKAKISAAIPGSAAVFSATEKVAGIAAKPIKLVGGITASALESQSIKTAKKDVGSDVNDELAKETKKKAQGALDTVADKMNTKDANKSGQQLEQELKTTKEKLRKAGNEEGDLPGPIKEELSKLEQEEKRLTDHLATFVAKDNSIGGLVVGAAAFENAKNSTTAQLASIRDDIATKKATSKQKSDDVANLEKEVKELEAKIDKRKTLIKDQIDKLKKEGVTFKRKIFVGTPEEAEIDIDEDEEGLRTYIRAGKEVENKELGAKLSKIEEKFDNSDSGGDTEKAKSSGDNEAKDGDKKSK